MNLTEKMKEKEKEKQSSIKEKYDEFMKSLSGKDKVKLAFEASASNYWGKIGKVEVVETRETEKGTKYYLVIACIIKDREKQKLLQEWFIGKDGNAKVAGKKNILIPDDLSDEVSILLGEEFEIEE